MGVPANATGEPDADALMIAEDAKRPGKDYCQGCADEFPISEMRLITRATDPYRQFDSDEEEPFSEENRVRMCKACFAREYESDDDDEASDQNTECDPTPRDATQ